MDTEMQRVHAIIHNLDDLPTRNRADNFIPRPSDIIIAGYGKSGTTWMQQIVHQIRTKGDENFDDIYDVVPFLPFGDRPLDFDANADQVSEPRIFKSHASYERIQQIEGKTRFIVTIRDPYDAEYSLIKFLWRWYGSDRDVTSDEYMQLSVPGVPKNMACDFATFISSWYPRRHQSNVLLLPYEDLKQNLTKCIGKIAEFINLGPFTDDEFSKILHFCSFDYMSKRKEKFSGKRLMEFWSKGAKVEYKPIFSGMVRVDGGQVGQGMKSLDETVKKCIDQRWEDGIKNTLGIRNYQELYQQCTLFAKE